MSAISTVYKRPSSVSTFNKDDDNRAVVYTGGLMTAFMWIVVGLASAANTEITPNVTGKTRCICIFRNYARLCVLPGISVSVTVIDALVMVLVNLFLMRGIEKVSTCKILIIVALHIFQSNSESTSFISLHKKSDFQ